MIRSVEEFASAFHAAHRVSTPLVAVRRADPASTTHFIIETLSKAGCRSLQLAIPSRVCHPNCVGASRWTRSSLTWPRARNARRSGEPISRSTTCQASYQTTKAGPVWRSKSAAGRRTVWESLSRRPCATSCRFHVPRLSRPRRYARWHQGSSSAPRHRVFTSTRKTRQRLGDASCGTWADRPRSCHPPNPRPEYLLPDYVFRPNHQLRLMGTFQVTVAYVRVNLPRAIWLPLHDNTVLD